MSNPPQKPFRELRIQAARSMWHTFYWIDQALQHHIREFEAQPELLAKLATQARHPIDMVARLEQLRQATRQLERDFDAVKIHSTWLQNALDDREPRFEELPPEQAARLTRLNEQLNGVAQHIQQAADAIDAPLAGPLLDPANRLVDRNLDARLLFELREDDPAHDDHEDNLVAEVKLSGRLSARQGATIDEAPFHEFTRSWPDGFDCTFPMPHDGLMHELRLYSGYEGGGVDYRDLLRIGSVWVDIVVTYQYQYDLTTGQWIKDWVREDDQPGHPVYVRDA